MGGAATVSDDAGLQLIFRQARQYRIRRFALSHFLLQRPAALDVFRRRAPEFHEYYRGKSAADHQGLFSQAGVAAFFRALRIGGFWRFILDVCRADDLLRHTSDGCHVLVSSVSAAGDPDSAWRGTVALSNECYLPGRALRDAVPGAILAVRFSGG